MCLLNISYLIHAHPDLLLDTLISLLDTQYIIFYVLFARPVHVLLDDLSNYFIIFN